DAVVPAPPPVGWFGEDASSVPHAAVPATAIQHDARTAVHERATMGPPRSKPTRTEPGSAERAGGQNRIAPDGHARAELACGTPPTHRTPPPPTAATPTPIATSATIPFVRAPSASGPSRAGASLAWLKPSAPNVRPVPIAATPPPIKTIG